MELVNLLFTFGTCILIGVLAYWKHLLDLPGTVSAFVVGFCIGLFGGYPWLLLLLLFLFASFFATKYKFKTKKELGLQEGVAGERGWKNVIANGCVPMGIAFLSHFYSSGFTHTQYVLFYLVAIAGAAADTLASEIGVLSDRVYLITNFRRVARGTNGGISVLGLCWAFTGSLFVSVIGIGFFGILGEIYVHDAWSILQNISFVCILGFAGCQIDSVLGATLENRGLLTKGTNNLFSISLTVMLAVVIIWLV
ncbi:MAG: DUF92 domain-containing protein [Thermoplasmata archaeon]